jgi:predicted transcriptional regulator
MIQRLGGAIDLRVLVFDKGELVGIISPADIARLLTIRQRQAGAQR